MRRIKVNADANNPLVIVLMFITVILFIACLYFIYFEGINFEIIECLVFSLVVIIYFIGFHFHKGEYVSDLLISKTAIALIYTHKRKKRQTVISLKDIESIKAHYVAIKTRVDIIQKNGEHIIFDDFLGKNLSFCNYKFLLDLIAVSESLPNFTYEVFMCSKSTRENIEYFRIHGKRPTIFENFKKELGKMSIFTIIILFVIANIIIFFIFVTINPTILEIVLK